MQNVQLLPESITRSICAILQSHPNVRKGYTDEGSDCNIDRDLEKALALVMRIPLAVA